MCGRYVAVQAPEQLAAEFEVERVAVSGQVEPDYNVAPTKPVLGVLARVPRDQPDGPAQRQLRTLRWGLIPSWAKDRAIGNRLINARVESAPDKPSFRKAFEKRRCILPALGFYEWDQPAAREKGSKAPPKQPYFIHRADGSTLAMAGLYELWLDPKRDRDDPEAWLWSCTVLTTRATDEAGRIHDRAPLVVPASAYEAWLAPELGDTDLRELLVPATVGVRVDPVSTAVNNVANNGPQLIEPLPGDQGEPHDLR